MGHGGDNVDPGGPAALLLSGPRLADCLHDLPECGHQADGVTRHDEDHDEHRHPRDQNLALTDQFLEAKEHFYNKCFLN